MDTTHRSKCTFFVVVLVFVLKFGQFTANGGRREGSVPMISAGLEGRLPYMTYPEPWRGQPKQHPEFLRPAPKPVPPSRYNGVSSTSPNGTRLGPSQRSISKYESPSTIPVNLTQHKDEATDELSYNHYRLYTPAHFSHFPSFSMYQTPYSHMIRPTFPTTPLPPIDTFSPTTPTAITVSSTFLSPPSTYSPPIATSIKPGQSILRDKRTPPQQPQPPPPPLPQQPQQQLSTQSQVAFKVPSGKEGSLKHRILTRPEEMGRSTIALPLDLQKTPSGIDQQAARKRLNAATMSPPRSPKKMLNNNIVPGMFQEGMLIKLANGELRRIEDMRTEDFVNSAERCPELRLADSTVIRIEENHAVGTATVTLSYNQRRTQAEVEYALEHPFFVVRRGWASCDPMKTQQCYKLKVHRLQVGDVLISLTPREQFLNTTLSRPATIMTTATSTAMTARQISANPMKTTTSTTVAAASTTTKENNDQIIVACSSSSSSSNYHIQLPMNLHTPTHSSHSMSPDSLAARKRRWSAPDQICDEDDSTTNNNIRRRID